jgi:hypothetical protein
MSKYPDIQLKKDVPAKDIHGNKIEIPEGEVLTPYEIKGNKVLLQDGQTYVVAKNQFQNIKGNSVVSEAKEFAPELKGTEETIKGASKWKGDELIDNGEVVANVVKNKDGTWSYKSDFSEGSDTFKTRKEAMDYAEGDTIGTYSKGETKYSSYQLPGGENYKEILIKAPDTRKTVGVGKIESVFDLQDYYAKKMFGEDKFYKLSAFQKQKVFDDVNYSKLHDKLKENKVINTRVDITDDGIKSQEGAFKSSHWDEPNVIAHIRMNERTYKGKKVAFMEELQSDWAREGRSKGFDKQSYELKPINDKGGYGLFYQGSETPAYSGSKSQAELMLAKMKEGNIPNHPLLKDWQKPTIKRALKEAVDSNADYFAWTTGEQQSARYNLATHLENVNWNVGKTGVKKIELKPKSGGEDIVLAVDKNGEVLTSSHHQMIGKKLDEVIGKGLADNIISQEKGTLSGEGLKFGGEWANNLYDKQVKNIVEDLTGAKVEMIDLGLPIDTKIEKWLIGVTDVYAKPLTCDSLKVGKEIGKTKSASGGLFNPDTYVVTDILGDGKFKAVPKDYFDTFPQFKSLMRGEKGLLKTKVGEQWTKAQQEFDIPTKNTPQQAIKITPEIRALVKGEAPKLTK